MASLTVSEITRATEADLAAARIGPRFSRLDLPSKLAVLAVEAQAVNFGTTARERIGICLAARGGSLATDVEYWKGRALAGGPSPTLFAYTLPSAAIGEISIRHRIMGPSLCFFGDDAHLVEEAGDMIRRGEAEAVLCVYCNVVPPEAAALLQGPSSAMASAYFLRRRVIGSDIDPAASSMLAQESQT